MIRISKKSIIILSAFLLITGAIIYVLPVIKAYQTVRIRDVSYEEGKVFCFNKIKKQYPQLLKKQYFYFNVWNVACSPCIKEMPVLDDLADSLSKKIAFIYISDDSEEKVNSFIERKKLKSRNFVFLNDMNTYISAAYNNQKITSQAYPTHIITDSIGKILLFEQGTISYFVVPEGKTPSAKEKAVYEQFKDPVVKFLENIK